MKDPEGIGAAMRAHIESALYAPPVKRKRTNTCMSYWFPLILKAGIPVPKTVLIETDLELIRLLDGESVDGFWDFICSIQDAAVDIGGAPFFLRTGLTSGKHEWKNTCYVPDNVPKVISDHVMHIVNYSALAGIMGLATDVWAVREMLNTFPVFDTDMGMPITQEFRYFVKDGEITHRQPYWPPEAMDYEKNIPESWKVQLDEINVLHPEVDEQLTDLTLQVNKAVPGYWSVDWLYTDRGWFCTDMAEGEKSYKWDPNDES